MNMQLGFHFDQTRCNGCLACIVACKDWHDVPEGPASWIRIKTVEKGRFPELFLAFAFATCYQCARPACVAACPVDAIARREQDGIVVVDRAACLGKDKCRLCLEACSYEAPQFGAEAGAKMQKCDLCLERWAEGKKPVCVEGCPARALEAGSLDELRKKYGDGRQAEGFVYSEKLGPAIIFKPKLDTRKLEVQRVDITPTLPG
ncbi:MAG: 4Fe-4S dicluster domain-containing protein [Chloroflexi bacterium]|nr:4Fe-4S dicluster domain-containing protein [Chloroflexota bacterium]